MSKKPIKIKKDDYDRVLITEVFPHETPIIFTGSGLYRQIKRVGEKGPIHDSIINTFVGNKVSGRSVKKNYTVPFEYKIRKNSSELRRLKIIHPIAQWKYKEFYKNNHNLLIHYCSVSPSSIRAPTKVAGSYYRKSLWESINKYRKGSVSTLVDDDVSKYSPSFFCYRGYDRLYKFFDSEEFFDLEKRFSVFWSADVSKCFDSIYTHTLSWAVKDKDSTKKSVDEKEKGTFAQEFDDLMMYANYRETNGIVIGPEISRIFSEIIFQKVDIQAIARLKEVSRLKYEDDYCIKRYVDDIFIFAKNEDVASKVHACYADILLSFNLHTNNSKTIKLKRPFVTTKSRLVSSIKKEVDEFLSRFIDKDDFETIYPKEIINSWALLRNFIGLLKFHCSVNDSNYDEVSSYLIAIFCERIKKLTNCYVVKDEDKSNYLSAICIMLDVVYFLYEVSPSISASYKLCVASIIAIEFSRRAIPDCSPVVYQKIYDSVFFHISKQKISEHNLVEGFVSLETLNLLIMARDLGPDYLFPEQVIESMFEDKKNLSYFEIISLLFYVRDSQNYQGLRRRLFDEVEIKLSNLTDILENSEKAHIFLDILFCPYYCEAKKVELVRRIYGVFGYRLPTENEIVSFVRSLKGEFFQVKWEQVDLLSQLEKKELMRSY